MNGQLLQISSRPDKDRLAERTKLVRQAKLLVWLGVGCPGIEAAIAVGAGSSRALSRSWVTGRTRSSSR